MDIRISPIFGALALAVTMPAASDPGVDGAAAITPEGIFRHVRVLASDAFEGRAPGTVGEERTVAYLTAELQKIGLQPGNPDGSFIQPVPAVGFSATATLAFRVGGHRSELIPFTDFVAASHRLEPSVEVKDSEVVFVGYGVVAPEYGWDDYKDVDVRGKTILMLIGDPPIPDPADPSRLDPTMFKGRAMTYYGRWTYKYEIAAKKGAAAAILVHETQPAAYPWSVVQASWAGESFALVDAQRNTDLVAVESWITRDQAVRLAGETGHDFDQLKATAMRRDFRPVVLGARADLAVKNQLREVATRNVVACLRGADPKVRDEILVYSAHWDHLGRDPKRQGDQICHGAKDNASAVGGMLEIARAFLTAAERPRRSLVFLFTTLEEKGLLGARYYAQHPLYPIARTLAVLNKDVLNPDGPTRDISFTGEDDSTLVDLLRTHAAAQGRRVVGDPKPENGSAFRSDHFEFVKVGVPALDLGSGIDFVDRPEGWGLARLQDYIAHDYHQPGDNVKPDWTFEGGAQDARLLFAIGTEIANSDTRPIWKTANRPPTQP